MPYLRNSRRGLKHVDKYYNVLLYVYHLHIMIKDFLFILKTLNLRCTSFALNDY